MYIYNPNLIILYYVSQWYTCPNPKEFTIRAIYGFLPPGTMPNI